MANHQALISEAVTLSLLGIGRTYPNPIVGALITDGNDKILSSGFHQGGAHAEIQAFNNLASIPNGIPNGASLYITLEPCSHHGKTPPCTDAIIASGIKNVFYSVVDPNPTAAGGAEKLRAAGIKVEHIDCVSALTSNRDWLTKIKKNRPRIAWKIAVSLDGAVAAEDLTSKWITGSESRNDVKIERSAADLIVTGTGTVLADNPKLLGKDKNPTRLILGYREIPKNYQIFSDDAETIEIKNRDIEEVLSFSRARGFNRILIEAGPVLGSAFFKAGLVDEIIFYQAPVILGSSRRFTTGIDLNTIGEKLQLFPYKIERLKNDIKQILMVESAINKELMCLQG
ncbi:MAG: bifunctional diaminohydroxyphosphoribosylaminopyrimidine deaminase/5-amino-6-(5-phosphoribosylamino)uracil reductase RibD [Actinomycetota bacterium]|nr:bifunctional diaminohydroxyphosphoribosylaminopyrimidine deaminase/5-amino-6-(5-phosphoribosylamino)uracil reductase RibD [Actinomycetota bacterium]